MPGPVTARSGNVRKQGPRIRVPIEVRILARVLFMYIPLVLYHNWRLTRHNSVQPGSWATFVLRTAGVTKTRLANSMRLAQGFSKIQ